MTTTTTLAELQWELEYRSDCFNQLRSESKVSLFELMHTDAYKQMREAVDVASTNLNNFKAKKP